jgi:hypothetical protein
MTGRGRIELYPGPGSCRKPNLTGSETGGGELVFRDAEHAVGGLPVLGEPADDRLGALAAYRTSSSVTATH